MSDRDYLDPEDFLADSTFQSYCAGTNERCIQYWEKWILAHPHKKDTINEAKKIYFILSGHKKPSNQAVIDLQSKLEPTLISPLRKKYTWLKVAAILILISSLTLLFIPKLFNTKKLNTIAANSYKTSRGEKKKIILRDGTIVILNAESSLTLNKDFNAEKRNVTLVGEAYFDVKQQINKPFIVSTSRFNINVLGTAFNVKAYPNEPTSEATLIKGSIAMEDKQSQGSYITMKPSQKVIFHESLPQADQTINSKDLLNHSPEVSIDRYTQLRGNVIMETAWTQNSLEINDQSLAEIKPVLERWYNITIEFKDKSVMDLRYIATFNNDSIVDVLNSLQKVEHFNYEIKGENIVISK